MSTHETTYLVNQQTQAGPTLIQPAIRWEMGKECRKILAQERQSQSLVTTKPGVDNQAHGDDCNDSLKLDRFFIGFE
jgi:hypothetical protein